MNALVSFMQRHAVLTACGIALVAACVALMQRPFALHNDDMQIYFLLLNGGETGGSLGYGIYTNYVLGWCIGKLSCMCSTLNVYLLYLFLLSFIACGAANYIVLEARARGGEDRPGGAGCITLISLILLFLVNVACMRSLQYTYVAIWAVLSGVFIVGSIKEKARWWWKAIVGLILVVGSYSLRESVLVPAAFVGIPAILYGWRRSKRVLVVAMAIGVVIVALAVMNRLVYNNTPEWNEARLYLTNRVKILDSPDNSGMDKSAWLKEQGIDAEAYSLFKQFIYVPSMHDAEKVQAAVQIHREGRKGVLGSECLANLGMLAGASISQRLCIEGTSTTIFHRITPWVPLLVAVFLLLCGGRKESLRPAMAMGGAIVCYLVVLFMLQRMVGRVTDPVLYAGAVWMLTLLPVRARWYVKKWVCLACAGCAACAVMFFTRHWHFWERADAAAQYCTAHPDKLYLTTCQQGFGLYPRGFGGYSCHWMHKSNILPIADGWSFYTPAYKAALAARGFASLKDAMMHEDTLIVIRSGSEAYMRQVLPKLVRCEWGKKIELSIVDTYGEFHFAKVLQK